MAYRLPIHKGRGRDRKIVAFALVSERDRKRVQRYRWFPYGLRGQYAGAYIDGRITLLHRFILEMEKRDALEIDHKNRNKLDCRRSNLRLVDRKTNGRNLPSQKGSTSMYRGVSWCSQTQKWRASMMIDRKFIHIGRFSSEGEAAAAARQARLALMVGALD